MIYFDNAATTLVKPKSVYEAVLSAMQTQGNAGRGAGDNALLAARKIYEARVMLTDLFGGTDPSGLVFTANATEALNIALHGLFQPGDHVITTEAEHNSVLRPLYDEEKRGLLLTVLPLGEDGRLDPEDFARAIRPQTKAIVCTHASNVLGNVYDIEKIGAIAHERGLLFIVDASQTAGALPVDVERMNIDILCFTGHKGLYGPQGTGGMYVRPGIAIRPLLQGGSGVHSFKKEHPQEMPTALEAGTLNGHGIAGLAAGAAFVKEITPEAIHEKEKQLKQLFCERLKRQPSIRIYGDHSGKAATVGICSLTIGEVDSAEVSQILMEEYGIATRSGAHCAPLVHERMGTREQGMVRFSFSWFTTEEEVIRASDAVCELAEELTGHM